jgi:hypothetical protein
MKRLMTVLMLVSASVSSSQIAHAGAADTCPALGKEYASAGYLDKVWQYAVPEDTPGSLMLISVSVGTESKIVLRARDTGPIELLRGTSTQPLYDTLDTLARACRLPFDPSLAAALLPVRWERVEIGPETFAGLHRSFTAALSDSMRVTQGRYSSLMARGGRFLVHSTRYHVIYKSLGYDHVEAIVDAVGSTTKKDSPLLDWIRQLLALSERTFPK